jgi:hypothetical protein
VLQDSASVVFPEEVIGAQEAWVGVPSVLASYHSVVRVVSQHPRHLLGWSLRGFWP